MGLAILPSGLGPPPPPPPPSAKVYLTYSGILHSLLGLKTMAEVEAHPKLEASGWTMTAIAKIAEIPHRFAFGQVS